MEQKQTKQRNMKSSTEKSSPAAEKMVLKAESVVEVSKPTKNAKASAAATTNQASATPAPKQVKSTPAKKTETPVQQAQATPAPAKATKAKAAPTPTPAPAPTQTAGQVKGQKAKTQAAPAPTQAAPVQTQAAPVQTQAARKAKGKSAVQTVQTATSAPVKTPRATKKAATEAATTAPQKAGAKKAATETPKKVQKVKAEEVQEEKQMDDKLRYFKLYYNDNICGRYSGKKPKQAANKAFSSIIKDMKKTDNKEGVNVDITFTIKECTRNSFHKEYKYVGKRLLLKSPVKVTIENGDGTSKDIVYKYHNELKKAPKV